MIQILSKNCFSDISQFEIDKTRTIGKGSFGVVRLAIHKGTNKIYAIKIIDLNNIQREYELKLIERQINLHSSLDHPHIIKLWDTILEKNMVYLIMEYAQCGNLFHHQNTKFKFNEAETFKFFIQIVKAVGYMHSQDTMHRDIKPENILLDKRGNALLADFGWSAKGINQERSTFCGTYEYMAPEMIAKQSYNYKVDVWSLGILLYEMLHGTAPFTGETLPEVQKKVQKGEYGIHASLSPQVKSLIRDILQFNPLNRNDIKEIIKHPWIKKMQMQINGIIKKQLIRGPASIGQIISKIVTDNEKKQGKTKMTHKKTESSINMFGYNSPKKEIVCDDGSNNQEDAKRIKKNKKAFKTMADDSIKKLVFQRTQSPLFQAKQNCESMGKTKQVKLMKHRKQQHARMMTQINDKLKMGSTSHLRTNLRNITDKRQSRK